MSSTPPPKPPPVPPGYVPIVGTVGEEGRVTLTRPIPRPRPRAAFTVAGRPVPDWMATLDRMVEAGTLIRASCQTCHAWRAVPLEELVGSYGPEGSLWDQAPACHVAGCSGQVLFLASPAAGTPFRPLSSWSQATRKLHR
jgi:hypothetical protein